MDENTPPNIDEQLRFAYERCHYVLFEPATTVLIGKRNEVLDAFLSEQNTFVAVIITAFNPASKKRTLMQNEVHQELLQLRLNEMELQYRLGENQDTDGHWPVEPTFLILGIDIDRAKQLAMEFAQLAVVIYQVEKGAKLLFV